MQTQDRDLLNALIPNEHVSRRARRALAPLGTTLELADRTVIEREGDDCAQLVVLVRGVAAVTVNGTLEEMLGRGDVWGDAGHSGAVARRTLVAAGPVRIHAYSVREFNALRDLLPELGQRLLRTGTVAAGLFRPAPTLSPPVPVRAGRAEEAHARPTNTADL
jgi:hypothetical protein